MDTKHKISLIHTLLLCIEDTRPKNCASWIPDVYIMYHGHHRQILCIMYIGHQKCISWTLDISIVYRGSWRTPINIVYQ